MRVDGVELPDARLDLWARRRRTELSGPAGRLYERIFCVNCGAAGGLVVKGCPVFFVCEKCVDRHGPPPGAIEVSGDPVR